MTGRILVTGGTGTVGSHVVDMLAARSDAQIRVLTRNPAATFPAGVRLVVGDLSDPTSVQTAMEGCTALFLLSSGLDLPTRDAIAARAAREAGVGRIVKVSVLGVGHDAHDPITRGSAIRTTTSSHEKTAKVRRAADRSLPEVDDRWLTPPP